MNPEEYALVRSILAKYLDPNLNQVFLYGSRAAGSNRRYSDVDLGVLGAKLPTMLRADLEDAFEESTLPYVVELVEFAEVSPEFRAVALSATTPVFP